MLGWEVGTFEFVSDRILALDYTSHAKIKLRTGGSSGKLSRSHCKKLAEGDGIYWDITKTNGKSSVRLPVKYRYRSPVALEFHTAGKRKADAYAVIWMQHLTDNEVTNINIPIWRTKNGARLTQNYVTEENIKSIDGYEDVTEVGRVHFRGRFKPGLDEDHEPFISDNDSRETYETWEACKAEGVRSRVVVAEVPEKLQQLHEESLLEGRDTLKQASLREKKQWMAKDGTDWSGAFGQDPANFVAGDKSTKGSDGAGNAAGLEGHNDENDVDDGSSSSDSDLGIHEGRASNSQGMNGGTNGSADGLTPSSTGIESEKERKRNLHRNHRGIMEWKPMRNAAFAKNEAVFALRRVKNKMTGGLTGRDPDVETEM